MYARSINENYVCYAIDFPGKIKELNSVVRNVILLRRLLQTHRFDIIHCNGSPDHRLVVLTLLTLKKEFRPKIVFTKHNSFKIKDSLFTKWRYRSWSDHVITVCNKQKFDIENVIPQVNAVTNISNGVCLKHYHPVTSKDKNEIRHKLKLASNKLIFVSAAGTGLHKGWLYLASATKNKLDYLVIVLGNKPSAATLEKLFGKNIPKNLLFPGHQADIRPYLWAADVGFVLSTDVETTSFACREKMACGLPVIVSDTGCLPENVDLETGWVVSAGSKEDVEQVIQRLKKQDLVSMQLAARRRAEKLFDIENFRNETYDIYRNLRRSRE